MGAGILAGSIRDIRIVVDGGTGRPGPGLVALVAAGVSIVVKEILYRYTVREGRAVDSPSVVANAWHHRSDALSSLGTLVGIACAYFLGQKWRIADPIAALVVAVFIFKVAFDLVRTGLNELLERSLPADVEEEILRIVTADPEVCQPQQPADPPHRGRDCRRSARPHGRGDDRGALPRPDGRHRTPPARPLRRGHDDRHSCGAAEIAGRGRAESHRPLLPVRRRRGPSFCPHTGCFSRHGFCLFWAAINVPEYCRRSRKIWYFRKKCLSCQRKASENSDVFKARTRNCNDIRQLKKDRLSGKKSTLSN